MREKIGYIVAAFICYLLFGMVMSYFSFSMLDWKYIFGWTIFMTLADFFIIRKIRIYYTNKYNKNGN